VQPAPSREPLPANAESKKKEEKEKKKPILLYKFVYSVPACPPLVAQQRRGRQGKEEKREKKRKRKKKGQHLTAPG